MLVGGEVQMEAFPDSDTWRFKNANSFSMKSANPADTRVLLQHGGGLFDPDNGIPESGNNRPQMPIAECDYILDSSVRAGYRAGPSDAPYTGYLPYQFNEATELSTSGFGKMMAICMESFNDGDVNGEAMLIIRNGKIETPPGSTTNAATMGLRPFP